MILRPDIYDHNNPIYPIVNVNSTKGGKHILPYTVERVDIPSYSVDSRINIPERHLIEGMIVIERVVGVNPKAWAEWRLIDVSLHAVEEGWELVRYGKNYFLTASENVDGANIDLTDNEGGVDTVQLLEKAAGPGASAKNVLIERISEDQINVYHDIVQNQDNEFLTESFEGSSVMRNLTIKGDHTGHIKSITTLARDMHLKELFDVVITTPTVNDVIYWDGTQWINGDIHDLIDPTLVDTYQVKISGPTDTPNYIDSKLLAGSDIDLAVDTTDLNDYKVEIINAGPFTYSDTAGFIVPRLPNFDILLAGGEAIIFQGGGWPLVDFRIDGQVDWAKDDVTVSAKAIASTYDNYDYWIVANNTVTHEVYSTEQVKFLGTGSTDVVISVVDQDKIVTINSVVADESKWVQDLDPDYLYPKVLTTKVGIGTATPEFQFHVEGLTAGINLIRTDSRANYQAFIRMGNQSIASGQIRAIDSASGGGLRFTNNTSSIEAFRFTESGLVGMGNVVPTHNLDVNGAVRFRTIPVNPNPAVTILAPAGDGEIQSRTASELMGDIGANRTLTINGDTYITVDTPAQNLATDPTWNLTFDSDSFDNYSFWYVRFDSGTPDYAITTQYGVDFVAGRNVGITKGISPDGTLQMIFDAGTGGETDCIEIRNNTNDNIITASGESCVIIGEDYFRYLQTSYQEQLLSRSQLGFTVSVNAVNADTTNWQIALPRHWFTVDAYTNSDNTTDFNQATGIYTCAAEDTYACTLNFDITSKLDLEVTYIEIGVKINGGSIEYKQSTTNQGGVTSLYWAQTLNLNLGDTVEWWVYVDFNGADDPSSTNTLYIPPYTQVVAPVYNQPTLYFSSFTDDATDTRAIDGMLLGELGWSGKDPGRQLGVNEKSAYINATATQDHTNTARGSTMQFFTSATDSTPEMVMTLLNGQVGIMTDAPNYVFDVKGNARIESYLYLDTIDNLNQTPAKFLVAHTLGVPVSFRTGTEVLADIGGVPELRNLTFVQGGGLVVTGTATQTLEADRTWTYTHAGNSFIDEGPLSAAEVYDSITVDSYGHLTSVTIRDLEPIDIGAPDIADILWVRDSTNIIKQTTDGDILQLTEVGGVLFTSLVTADVTGSAVFQATLSDDATTYLHMGNGKLTGNAATTVNFAVTGGASWIMNTTHELIGNTKVTGAAEITSSLTVGSVGNGIGNFLTISGAGLVTSRTPTLAMNDLGATRTLTMTSANTDLTITPTGAQPLSSNKTWTFTFAGDYDKYTSWEAADLLSTTDVLSGNKVSFVEIATDPIVTVTLNPTTKVFTFDHKDSPYGSITDLTTNVVFSNITTDIAGHVTATTTRVLTPADIGASPDTHLHDTRYVNIIGDTMTGDLILNNGESTNVAAAARVSYVDKRVRWRNIWVQDQYYTNDMVKDGDWTMIANKDTIDPAAPQPLGEEAWFHPDVPVWTPATVTDSVFTGIRVFNLSETYVINKVRAWVADVSSSAHYRILAKDNLTGVTETLEEFYGNRVSTPQWLEFDVADLFIGPGADLTIGVTSSVTSGSTQYNHPWVYTGTSQNNVDPGLGNINKDNQNNFIRINDTDDDGINRNTELDFVEADTVIKIVDETDANAYLQYDVINAVDNGTWWSYSVTLTGTGSSGVPGTGARCQVFFDVPSPAPTAYVILPDDFLTTPSVKGMLQIGIHGTPTQTDDAYGFDVFYQEYHFSPDWDLVATSSGGTGGESGGAISITHESTLQRNDPDQHSIAAISTLQTELDIRPFISSDPVGDSLYYAANGDTVPRELLPVTVGLDLSLTAGTLKHTTYNPSVPSFTGANVLNTLTVTNGHISAITNRTLTPADIGAQVAGDYDNYLKWIVTDGTTASDVTEGLAVTFTGTGATTVTQLGRTVTINSINTNPDRYTDGEAQDAVGAILTPSTDVYPPDIYFSYVSQTSLTAALTTTGVIAGTYNLAAITVNTKGRITSVTQHTGLTSTVDNSNGVVLQDITTANGLVQSVGTIDLDLRYAQKATGQNPYVAWWSDANTVSANQAISFGQFATVGISSVVNPTAGTNMDPLVVVGALKNDIIGVSVRNTDLDHGGTGFRAYKSATGTDYLVLEGGSTSSGYTRFGLAANTMSTVYTTGGTTHHLVVGTIGVHDLVFGTSNIVRGRVLANGNFAIGASTATHMLDVTGTGRFTSTLTLDSVADLAATPVEMLVRDQADNSVKLRLFTDLLTDIGAQPAGDYFTKEWRVAANIPAVASGTDLNTDLPDGGLISNYGSAAYWINTPVSSYGMVEAGMNSTGTTGNQWFWDYNHGDDDEADIYTRTYSTRSTGAGWTPWMRLLGETELDATYEPVVAVGSASEFYAWDKTWKPLIYSYITDPPDLSVYTLQTDFLAHTGDTTIHFTKASISHTEILDIGINTHLQIDSHISSTANPHNVTLHQLLANGTSPQYLWYNKTWRTIQYSDISGTPTIDNSKWDRDATNAIVKPKTINDKVYLQESNNAKTSGFDHMINIFGNGTDGWLSALKMERASGYGSSQIDFGYHDSNSHLRIISGTDTSVMSMIRLSRQQYSAAGSPGEITFYTSPLGSGSYSYDTVPEAMRITGAGYVGINNSSPLYPLDVSGITRISSTLLLTSVVSATVAKPVLVLDGNEVKQRALDDLKDDLGISDLETRPTAPAGLVLTEYASYVEVAFTGDATNDYYEIYVSEVSATGDFDMIGKIPQDQIVASIIFIDDTYTIKGQLWYKIYAVKHGLISTPTAGTITTTNDVGDVTGLTIITDAHHFHAQWDNPTDRRLASTKVTVQFNDTDAGWDENAGTVMYQGLRENVIYPIDPANKDKFIKVWATTVTRT